MKILICNSLIYVKKILKIFSLLIVIFAILILPYKYINLFKISFNIETLKFILKNTAPILSRYKTQTNNVRNLIYIKNNLNILNSKNKIGQESSIYQDESENTVDYGIVEKYENIMIRNHTDYEIDLKTLKEEKINIDLKYNNPKVFIYHTHTSESYKMKKEGEYLSTDNFRTIDSNYNVIKVGKNLISELDKYSINSRQSETIHDYPEYTGSYDRAIETVEHFANSTPDVPIIIDLHRDAAGENEQEFRLIANVEGKETAKLMMVIGTDDGGLKHDEWKENLKLAIKMQDLGNRMYPGLFREIDIRKERFNQHITKGAFILEVGGTGNTLDEATQSMKYFASIINKLCND